MRDSLVAEGWCRWERCSKTKKGGGVGEGRLIEEERYGFQGAGTLYRMTCCAYHLPLVAYVPCVRWCPCGRVQAFWCPTSLSCGAESAFLRWTTTCPGLPSPPQASTHSSCSCLAPHPIPPPRSSLPPDHVLTVRVVREKALGFDQASRLTQARALATLSPSAPAQLSSEGYVSLTWCYSPDQAD